MSPREIAACYRLYAANCVEIARYVPDSGRKVALLNMAQAWAKLAENAERNSGCHLAEGTPFEKAEHRHE
jgi:hypothetical protein